MTSDSPTRGGYSKNFSKQAARQESDFAQLSQVKLMMPVLSIGGEKSLGNELGAQMKLVADKRLRRWSIFFSSFRQETSPEHFLKMIGCVLRNRHDSLRLLDYSV